MEVWQAHSRLCWPCSKSWTENGYLVNVKNTPAFGNTTLALLNKALASRNFIEAGLVKVTSMFTQELYVVAIQNLLGDVSTTAQHSALSASACP